MPLKRGASRQVIGENIRHLLHIYKREGGIARSRPPDMDHARKQAAAIAYSLARRSRKQGKQAVAKRQT